MTLSKRMTSLCITLVVASLFLSIYASAASAPIHKTTVWVAPETETLINGIPESQTPMVTDVIMGPYFYRYDSAIIRLPSCAPHRSRSGCRPSRRSRCNQSRFPG